MLTQLFFGRQVLLIVAFLTVIGATALWGQAVNGTISGTVTDPSGAAIAGATVEVRNTATQVVRTVTTNAQNSVQTNVPVVVGGERVVDMTMKIGQAQAARVNTSSSAVSSLVETKQVEDLPLNGRNYTHFVELAPGVQPMKPTAPGFQADRHLVPPHNRGLLQLQEEEQSTLEKFLSGALVTSGRQVLLCLEKIRMSVDAHAGC
jgi:Carboxypeptidase regulatory-like domain